MGLVQRGLRSVTGGMVELMIRDVLPDHPRCPMKNAFLAAALAIAAAGISSHANADSILGPEKLKALIAYATVANQPSTMPEFIATGLGLHHPFQSDILSLEPDQLIHSFGVGVSEPVILFMRRTNPREMHIYTATPEGELIAAGVVVTTGFVPVAAESMRGEFEDELRVWNESDLPGTAH